METRAGENRKQFPPLRGVFGKAGPKPAANSSSISDGAAALVLMRRSTAEQKGLRPLALILDHATHAQEPSWFGTAPVGAMQKLYAKIGWKPAEVDLYEINEAVAVVVMAGVRGHGVGPRTG